MAPACAQALSRRVATVCSVGRDHFHWHRIPGAAECLMASRRSAPFATASNTAIANRPSRGSGPVSHCPIGAIASAPNAATRSRQSGMRVRGSAFLTDARTSSSEWVFKRDSPFSCRVHLEYPIAFDAQVSLGSPSPSSRQSGCHGRLRVSRHDELPAKRRAMLRDRSTFVVTQNLVGHSAMFCNALRGRSDCRR